MGFCTSLVLLKPLNGTAAGFETNHNTMIYNKIKNNIFIKDIIKDIPLISSLKKTQITATFAKLHNKKKQQHRTNYTTSNK